MTKDRMEMFVDAGHLIECSRCANDQFTSSMDDPDVARACERFRNDGWTFKYPRAFCPQCSSETGRRSA